jgi:hypothetical protein
MIGAEEQGFALALIIQQNRRWGHAWRIIISLCASTREKTNSNG